MPAGYHWIIKSILLANISGSATTGNLQLVNAAGTAAPYLHLFDLAAAGNDVTDCWVVALPGDYCQLTVNAGSVMYWLSGTELLLP